MNNEAHKHFTEAHAHISSILADTHTHTQTGLVCL